MNRKEYLASSFPYRRKDFVAIIPCFNDGAYLSRAITSILAAEILPQEIVVVDDCSTDPTTQRIVCALEDAPHIKVLRTNKNRGIGGARNYVLQTMPQYTYALALDADDCIEPTILREALQFLEQHPNYAAVGGYVKKYYYRPPNKHTVISYGYWKPKGGGLAAFLFTVEMHGTTLFRTKALQSIGGYKENIYYEDVDSWLRLTVKGWRIHSLKKTFLHYYARIHSDSKTRLQHTAQSIEQIYQTNRHIYHQHFYKGLCYLIYFTLRQPTNLKNLHMWHIVGKNSVGVQKIFYHTFCILYYPISLTWRFYLFLRKYLKDE